jgi:hypothetical protein
MPSEAELAENPVTYAISFAKAADLTSGEQTETRAFATALAETLVMNLNRRGFVLAEDSSQADQLLVVHAGTTEVPGDLINRTALQFATGGGLSPVPDTLYLDKQQNRQWVYNMRLLGYANAYQQEASLFGMFSQQLRLQDLSEDLRRPRNYVVVTAFDFKTAKMHPDAPMLWRTHISVRAGATPFAKQVDTLVSAASRHFGHHTPRLIRRFETEVRIGPMEVVEEDAP